MYPAVFWNLNNPAYPVVAPVTVPEMETTDVDCTPVNTIALGVKLIGCPKKKCAALLITTPVGAALAVTGKVIKAIVEIVVAL